MWTELGLEFRFLGVFFVVWLGRRGFFFGSWFLDLGDLFFLGLMVFEFWG